MLTYVIATVIATGMFLTFAVRAIMRKMGPPAPPRRERKRWVGATWALPIMLGVVGCSSGSAPSFEVAQGICVKGPTGWTASHDFKTTDPTVLSRVVVFIYGPEATVDRPIDKKAPDGGAIDGWFATPWFQGSTAFVECSGYDAMGEILFYVEP